MSLPDGRQIRPISRSGDEEKEIVVHPDFRLVLLANRPGFPFLGNAVRLSLFIRSLRR
jgi:hypothetical protein